MCSVFNANYLAYDNKLAHTRVWKLIVGNRWTLSLTNSLNTRPQHKLIFNGNKMQALIYCRLINCLFPRLTQGFVDVVNDFLFVSLFSHKANSATFRILYQIFNAVMSACQKSAADCVLEDGWSTTFTEGKPSYNGLSRYIKLKQGLSQLLFNH